MKVRSLFDKLNREAADEYQSALEKYYALLVSGDEKKLASELPRLMVELAKSEQHTEADEKRVADALEWKRLADTTPEKDKTFIKAYEAFVKAAHTRQEMNLKQNNLVAKAKGASDQAQFELDFAKKSAAKLKDLQTEDPTLYAAVTK